MKTIGLIGGMSFESTVTYYEMINEAVKERLGGFHSAKILLYSVDFAEIEKRQRADKWDECAEIIIDAAKRLELAGADMILICTNTIHKLADQVSASISIPLIHIAEATADVLKEKGMKKVGLLGTKYTMLQDFYKDKIVESGIDVIIPSLEDVEFINHVIFDELCLGTISETSRREFVRIIKTLRADGAEGIILGCTEIGLLVKSEDSDIPLFDTTIIHAMKAADLALKAE